MDLLIIFISCLFGYLCGRLDANIWHRTKCKYALEMFDKCWPAKGYSRTAWYKVIRKALAAER